MQNISLGGIGMYAFLLATALRLLGVEADINQITEFLVSLLQVVAFVVWVWGQVRRSDLKLGLIRK